MGVELDFIENRSFIFALKDLFGSLHRCTGNGAMLQSGSLNVNIVYWGLFGSLVGKANCIGHIHRP